MEEREAILDGYRQGAAYNAVSLLWCEVLNYLHFAYWSRENEPDYTSFALRRAMDLLGPIPVKWRKQVSE